MKQDPDTHYLSTCPVCGQVHRLPAVKSRGWQCTRCGHRWSVHNASSMRKLTAALALSALLLYTPAITLPIMSIERLGHSKATNIIDGILHLFGSGEVFIALIVLVCSIVIPVFKLFSLLLITSEWQLLNQRFRAKLFHLVDMLGRWGMLDVLLVAMLVAMLKLGDLVEVTVGPGLIAFACFVILSLLASISFKPLAMWEPSKI